MNEKKSERQSKAGSMEVESSQRSTSAKHHVIQASNERENNIPRINPLKALWLQYSDSLGEGPELVITCIHQAIIYPRKLDQYILWQM
jgi:hypothetical protein